MPLIEQAPARLFLNRFSDLLEWYERNLCEATLIDPRGHRISFPIERFPHLIKLLKKNSTEEVDHPQKQVRAIKAGTKANGDFGGYDTERAHTLTWILPIILRPTRILEVTSFPMFEAKPGDVLYLKQFGGTGRKFSYRALVCRRVGEKLLTPITCHPRNHDRYPKHYVQVWPTP